MSGGAKRASVDPAQALFWKGFEAWEESAAEAMRSVVADPRTLEFGASLLKMQLLWRSAANQAFEGLFAPLEGLAAAGKSRP